MSMAIISTRLPSLTREQVAKVWLGLHSLRRSEKEALKLLPSLEGLTFDVIQRTLFQHNLAELKQQIPPHQIQVGCVFCFSATCNQMSHIGERFEREKGYDFLALVNMENMPGNPQAKFKDFDSFYFLAVPDLISNSHLGSLNVVFLPETIDTYRWNFPSNVIKVGCPHGIDIPLHDTLHKYGGALSFDYILSPVTENKLAGNTIQDQYPAEVIDHSCNFVCSIPMGFPKLDAFYNVYKQANRVTNKIIYHLSNWELESEQVRENVGETLETLLTNFPNSEVLFRPFPRDVDRTELRNQLKHLEHYSNLTISTDTSYISDYADADILVTHRSKTGQIFSLASGKPIFTLDNGKENLSAHPTALGMQLYNRQQLVDQIGFYFQDPISLTGRIDQTRQDLLLNLGHALDYLLDNFNYVLESKPHPEWHYLTLFSDSKANIPGKQRLLDCLYKKLDKSTQFVHFSEAAVKVYPEDPEIRLIAAESRSRTPDPSIQNYFFEFHYLSLRHVNKALELCEYTNTDVLNKIYSWLERKGLHMAQALKFYIENNETQFGRDIGAIIKRLHKLNLHTKASKERQQSSKWSSPEAELSFSFDDLLSNVTPETRSIYLYGAGQVAIDFIRLNQKTERFRIEKIFDSDEAKQNSGLLGLEVSNIKDGISENIPIVICSIEYKREIELMLKEIFSDKVITIGLTKSAGWY